MGDITEARLREVEDLADSENLSASVEHTITGWWVTIRGSTDDGESFPELVFNNAEALTLHRWLTGALGLPDVAELQRRVDEAVSYLAQPLMRGYFLPTMPPALRALVEAARAKLEQKT